MRTYTAIIERCPDTGLYLGYVPGFPGANAQGAVSIQIGSGVTVSERVFAATEVAVLARNPNVDATTKDLLAYFGCIRSGHAAINTGFITA